jgi:hypothetical protein
MSTTLFRRFIPAFATLALAALVPPPARALVLTFDPVTSNFERIDPGYGDRVTATPQNGFSYGTDGGFTPNVVVEYGVLPEALPSLWKTGYGDLTNILFEDQDGYGHLEVTLTADVHWNVVLWGFDMAAYSAVAPINGVTVRDGQGNVLFSAPGAQIPSSGHGVFAFDPPLEAPVLIIAVDSHNLGTFSDNIGIDNISFGQISAPMPVRSTTWGKVKALYRAH